MTAHRVSQTNADARGIVRLSPDDLQAANLNPGDTVSLDAARRVYARAAPGHIKVGEVALDATTAQNAGVSIGDDVAVARAPLGLIEALHLRLPQRVAATPADLQEALFDMALTDGDEVGIALPGYGQSRAHVARVEPNGAGLVGDATAIVIETPPEAASDQTPAYAGIAGMRSQIERVHEIVSTPLLRPDLFAHLGLSAPKGLLFTGPPGSGKTLLARAVAKRTKAAFFQIDGAEILSKHYGESEAALRRVFEAASTAQPAIIFIDEIDALAPRRADLSGEKQVERRVVAQLLTLLDGLGDRGRVVVMAATNLPDAIDAALRRPGRFDREIAFTPPSETERAEILALHLAEAPLAADTDLAAIARQAVGYVGADLAALAREAGMAALARSVRAAGGETKLATQDVALTQADLEAGLAKSAPAALRSHASAARPVTWDDIGGLEAAKTNLLQAVEWPRKHPKSLAALGLSAPRGILLTGPPGGGKTLLARALAGAEAMNFIPVRPPDLLSQFLGQAERGLAQLFETARLTAPSLLFFDEIDALAPRRGTADAVFDRLVAQLLVELDGIAASPGVTVLAATNRAATLDPALLRPGRFDRIIDIPPPDATARKAILEVHFTARPLADATAIDTIVAATAGASGADLAALAEAAAWHALSRALASKAAPEIARVDIDAALVDHDKAAHARRRDHIAEPEVSG